MGPENFELVEIIFHNANSSCVCLYVLSTVRLPPLTLFWNSASCSFFAPSLVQVKTEHLYIRQLWESRLFISIIKQCIPRVFFL